MNGIKRDGNWWDASDIITSYEYMGYSNIRLLDQGMSGG